MLEFRVPMVICLFAGLLVSCKARQTGSALKNGAGTAAAKAQLSEDALKNIENQPLTNHPVAIQEACLGVQDSLYMETNEGGVVYSTRPLAKDPVQVSWDIGTAALKGRRWLLTNEFTDDQLPECVRNQNRLTTRALLVALRCASVDPCPAPAAACLGDECQPREPDLLAFSSAAGTDHAAGEPVGQDGESQQTVLALTSGSLTCRAQGDQVVLDSSGTVIGAPVPDQEACEAQVATERDGLVCAWNGSSFTGYTVRGGKPLSAQGLENLSACAETLAVIRDGIACQWNGARFSPVGTPGGTPKRLGEALRLDLAACQDSVETARNGLVCVRTVDGFQVFDLASASIVAAKVAFLNLDFCRDAVVTGKKIGNSTEEPREVIAAAGEVAEGPGSQGLGLTSVGYTLAHCHVENWWYHIVAHTKDSDGLRWLNKDCHIDTLYSWGPAQKVDYMREMAPNGKLWSGRFRRNGKDSPLFATNSPIGSFGYGPYAIRIKLKWDTKYKVFADHLEDWGPYTACRDNMTATEIEDTILVRYWNKDHGSGLDFILCGPGPIHSWSYGTQEHKNEIHREIDWYNANNYKSYELYYKQKGIDKLVGFNLDGHPFTNAVLLANQGYLTSLINSGNSHVFFNKAAGNSATEANHFNTRIPIYFNPN